MFQKTPVKDSGAKVQSRPLASNYKRSCQDFVDSRQPTSNLCVNSMKPGVRI